MQNNNTTYPYFGDPQYWPDNLNNPYGYQYQDTSEGLTYFQSPNSNSTMVSDSVVMTKRLKQFVPKASVMKGRTPSRDLMTREQLDEEDNRGDNYKSTFR